jgi:hypothetical protein
MKLTVLLTGLLLGWTICQAQTPDSAHRRRPNIFERRRIAIEEMQQRRDQDRERWASLPLYKADSDKWSISLNPLGIFEPQAAIGLGVGYQFDQHWQLWLESSYLFQVYTNNPSCIGGIREILAMKYYFGLRQSLFFSGEFRWKQVYFHDVADFIDENTYLAVPGDRYTLENIVFGGAISFGGRIRISKDHRWRLEPSFGLGFKGRTVVRQDVPDYYRYAKNPNFLVSAFSEPERNSARVTIYLPATVRFVYVL